MIIDVNIDNNTNNDYNDSNDHVTLTALMIKIIIMTVYNDNINYKNTLILK